MPRRQTVFPRRAPRLGTTALLLASAAAALFLLAQQSFRFSSTGPVAGETTENAPAAENPAAPSASAILSPDDFPRTEADPNAGAMLPPGEGVAPEPAEPTEPAPPPVPPETLAIEAAAKSLVAPERPYRDLLARVAAQTYEGRGYRPLWDDEVSLAATQRALSAIIATHAYPDFFALDPDSLASQLPETAVPKVDLALTIAILDAALLARIGILPPERIWSEWNKGKTPGSDNADPAAISGDLVLAANLRPFDLARALEQLGPKNRIYLDLWKAYPEARRAILQYSGLPAIPDPAQAGIGNPGEPYPFASAVATHLADRGYLQMDPALAQRLTAMTPELTAALMAFQRDYGLEVDGVFGPASWRYLNRNAADNYRSLSINLHRARLLPGDMGERYAIANIPCGELHLFERNHFHHSSMRIVYGATDPPEKRTVVFRDVMSEVVFCPYWFVPPGIIARDIVPKSREDIGFLERNDFEIVPDFNPSNRSTYPHTQENLDLVAQNRLFVRQRPGPTNSLGHVKFLFPNAYSIYFHDTPARELFALSQRDHSSGCVRVAAPEVLGSWLLGDNWSPERVKAAMDSATQSNHRVPQPVNVYITYLTTFPRPVGPGRTLLAPGRDAYDYDQRDSATLAAVLPWGTPSAGADGSAAASGTSSAQSPASGSAVPAAPAALTNQSAGR